MPVDDFSLWQQYHLLHPIDGTREDLHHGILCRLIAAAFAGESSEPADWIPCWESTDPQQDLERFKAEMMGMAAK